MSPMKNLKVALLLAAAVAIPRAAWAVGEVNGRIQGVVSEAATGAPVPGAAITVSGGQLIGGPRTVTTGDDGRYEIVELPPGRYDVEVSYSGVKPIKRRVIVRQGELLPLDIAWSAELAETEVTVVVEERHMTKPDSTQSGTVISLDTSSKVATSRSYQDIALQVAGVVDVNGGGNPQVKGGNLLMNRYLVDGLDITDPVTNTFSANINFDSISSIEVLTGGMEAQYNSMGGVINLITAGGSDEWHVDASLYVNNDKFSATGQYGSQLYDGQNQTTRIPPAPTQGYQANVNVGGPILKHRLWFNVSLEYDYTEASTPAGPPLNTQSPTRKFNSVFARLKLTWAPNEKHRVTLSASTDPAFISNINRASANKRLPIAQNYQEQGGAFGILSWDWFINQNINTNVQTGFLYEHLYDGSQGAFTSIDNNGSEKMFSDKNFKYNFNQPQHVNAQDGSVWYQGSAANTYDRRYAFQLDPSVSMRGRLAGYHDAKIGIQTRYIKSTFDVANTGQGVSYVDNGGGPLEGGLCDEATGRGGCFLKNVTSDYSTSYSGFSIGGYIQDRWKPVKRLTVLPGIRFDYGMTQNGIGQKVSDLFGVAPRIGFVLDLTGDQKTILSAFYGRSNDVANLLPAANGTPSAITNTYAWNPASGTVGQFSDLVQSSGGPKGYRIDPRATTPPHTDEVDVSLRREVFVNSVANIEYTYKKVSNLWDLVESNQVWDPTGYRTIGYVDSATPQTINLITTNSGLVREYQGVDFSIESRPTPNWDIYAAYTLSWLYGSGGDQLGGQVNGTPGANYNPRQTPFWDGYLPEDVRHVLKLRVAYSNSGFNVGGFFQYASGSPLTKTYFQYLPDGDFLNQRSPSGTEPGPTPNSPRGFSEFRLPDTIQLDVRVSYDFHALIKQHLVLIADLFNLFNLQTATAVEATNIPNFGQILTRQTPFKFQLGLRYQY